LKAGEHLKKKGAAKEFTIRNRKLGKKNKKSPYASQGMEEVVHLERGGVIPEHFLQKGHTSLAVEQVSEQKLGRCQTQ